MGKSNNNPSVKSLKSKGYAILSVIVFLIAGVGVLTGKIDLSEKTEPTTAAVSEEKTQNKETQKATSTSTITYRFRNKNYLNQHYEKHGKEMGFASASEYEAAACAVITNPDALHKKEAEDNDDVYYVEATNDFVIVSTDGYIRTYFRPDKGIDYYNRQ